MSIDSIYTSNHGDLLTAASVAEVKAHFETLGIPFFSKDTMEWFGTRDLRLYRGVVMTGHDTKAPEGYPAFWVRVFSPDGTAHKVGAFHTSREAREWARTLAGLIKDGQW